MNTRSVCLLSSFVLTACATTREESRATVVMPATAAPEPTVEITEPASPPVAVEVPRSRPRLSQTVTLGQGSEQPYMPMPAAPATATHAQTQNVVVNNNVVVQGGPGIGYAPYGFYGRGYGRPTTFVDGRSGARGGRTSGWSTTGWEGARRTAAPGQTPGVGGNWSPPPSYGPAQMK